MEQVLCMAMDFGRQKGDIDRLYVSLHGWSDSRGNPGLEEATRAFYGGLRQLFADW
jgi:hypothetical protein